MLIMPEAATADNPALTIYTKDFAVVRESIPLVLKRGVNEIIFTDITTLLEPDSVILRDPGGRFDIKILEQNYRADPVSQSLLLSLYEGQTIDFEVMENDVKRIIPGRIIRSGHIPAQYGYTYSRSGMTGRGAGQPIIEIDGRLRFSLPGLPLFPALKDDTILKPTISWQLDAGRSGSVDAELAYITDGMGWKAAYNVVSPETGDELDLIGWVTINNSSGKYFQDARIKLIAGDVNKLTEQNGRYERAVAMDMVLARETAPVVTEKTFDEYHLYTLNRKTSLHDRETKQVEFTRASGIDSRRLYIYDGASVDPGRNIRMENIRMDRNYGTQTNTRVWVIREFENSEENQLGIPLPAGRVRFYRQDDDGQLEFTGENLIDHTPRDETVRIYTGDAFDLTGERTQTNFQINNRERDWVDESFEIKLRNHKKEAVEITVVEHLYRWSNWNLTQTSDPYTRKDSQTIEFQVPLRPDEEKTVTYTVHYSW